MTTADQEGRPVLDFYRCAMLPLRDGAETGYADDLDVIGTAGPPVDVVGLVPGWDHDVYLAALRGRGSAGVPEMGEVLEVATGDVVSSAPELARLTLNVAAVHHDAQVAGGRRLVYGGHTIAIAASQVLRVLPNLATVLAWELCDHVGPVHEGDTLTTRVTVNRVLPATDGWRTVDLRAEVVADRDRTVLDWRFTALAP